MADGGKLQQRHTQVTAVTVSAPGFRNDLGVGYASRAAATGGGQLSGLQMGYELPDRDASTSILPSRHPTPPLSVPQSAQAAGFSSASGSPINKLGSPAGPTETAWLTRGAARVRRQRWGKERQETEWGQAAPVPNVCSLCAVQGRPAGA